MPETSNSRNKGASRLIRTNNTKNLSICSTKQLSGWRPTSIYCLLRNRSPTELRVALIFVSVGRHKNSGNGNGCNTRWPIKTSLADWPLKMLISDHAQVCLQSWFFDWLCLIRNIQVSPASKLRFIQTVLKMLLLSLMFQSACSIKTVHLIRKKVTKGNFFELSRRHLSFSDLPCCDEIRRAL